MVSQKLRRPFLHSGKVNCRFKHTRRLTRTIALDIRVHNTATISVAWHHIVTPITLLAASSDAFAQTILLPGITGLLGLWSSKQHRALPQVNAVEHKELLTLSCAQNVVSLAWHRACRTCKHPQAWMVKRKHASACLAACYLRDALNLDAKELFLNFAPRQMQNHFSKRLTCTLIVVW